MSREIIPEVTYDDDNFTDEDFKSLIAAETSSANVSIALDDKGSMVPTRDSNRPTVTRFEDDDDINPPVIPINRTGNVEQATVSTQPQQHAYQVQSQEPDYTQPEVVYQAAFDFIRETGLLEIPDDIQEMNQETLDFIIQSNRELMYQEVFDEITNKAGDGYVAELYRIVHDGGTLEDVKKLFDVQESSRNLDLYDVNDPTHQLALITMYLQEGLDPRNPVHNKRLQNVSVEAQGYIDRGEGLSTAKEAKTYYKGIQKQMLEDQRLVIERERVAKEQAAVQKLRAEQTWIHNFKETLSRRKWSGDKKNAVIEQFNKVSLTDGTEKLLWQYKMEQIWANPELTQHLMDFLSDFDPYQLRFKTKENTVEDLLNDKVKKLTLRNNRGTHTNSATYNKGQMAAENQKIDPTKY